MLVLIYERCWKEHGPHILSEGLNSNGLGVNTVVTSSPMLVLGTISATDDPLHLVKKVVWV